ncbi:MAG: hypothetical protein ABSF54_14285 [Bryobacteraceae bacterium]|jgi:hypothetical protein
MTPHAPTPPKTSPSGLDKAVQYTEIIDPAVSDGYQLRAAHAAGVARPT